MVCQRGPAGRRAVSAAADRGKPFSSRTHVHGPACGAGGRRCKGAPGSANPHRWTNCCATSTPATTPGCPAGAGVADRRTRRSAGCMPDLAEACTARRRRSARRRRGGARSRAVGELPAITRVTGGATAGSAGAAKRSTCAHAGRAGAGADRPRRAAGLRRAVAGRTSERAGAARRRAASVGRPARR